MKKNNWNIRFNGQGMTANSIITTIMKNRGILEDEIKDFLNPREDWLWPSDRLTNIHKAAGMVLHSRSPLIYADTDTDGCSAAAIMIRWFKDYLDKFFPGIPYQDPQYYINQGKDHGIQDYFKLPEDILIDTIIIVDSINDDPKYYLDLLNKGKNVIVLDHHLVPDEIKNINHPQFALVSSALDYPNPSLSGSGVVWKFCRYLDYLVGTDFADHYRDLAACGIVADVCSVGPDSMENRAICNLAFNTICNPALLALSRGTTFDSTFIGFTVGPLINAANRMNRNDLALSLFLADKKEDIDRIIKELEKVKKEQKTIVESLMPKLLEQAEYNKYSNCKIFFIEGYNTLTGLLATKLCEQFNRPCLVLHDEGDFYAGSMRAKGVPDFSALVNQSGYAQCMGHENSAGFLIDKRDFDSFRAYIEEILAPLPFVDGYDIDVELERAQISPFLLKEFKKIDKISGANFSSIKVCIDNVKSFEVKELSKGQHISVNTNDLKFLYWNFKEWDKVDKTATFSAVGSLSENVFFGRTSNQMLMEDYNFSKQESPFNDSHTTMFRRDIIF